jgi:hypothetical protein
MIWKFIYTNREWCKTGPAHNQCWKWSGWPKIFWDNFVLKKTVQHGTYVQNVWLNGVLQVILSLEIPSFFKDRIISKNLWPPRQSSASNMSKSCFASFPPCVNKFSSHYLNNIIVYRQQIGASSERITLYIYPQKYLWSQMTNHQDSGLNYNKRCQKILFCIHKHA